MFCLCKNRFGGLFTANLGSFDRFFAIFQFYSPQLLTDCPHLYPYAKDLGVDGQTCTLECTNENLIPIGINVLNPVRMQLRCIEDVDGNVVWNFRPENRPIKCVMKKFYIKGRCFLGMINTSYSSNSADSLCRIEVRKKNYVDLRAKRANKIEIYVTNGILIKIYIKIPKYIRIYIKFN